MEIMISIVLFSMIILFLYQTLDMTKKSNDFYTAKLKEQQERTKIASLFFKDILHAQPLAQTKSKITKDIAEDDSKRSMLWLKTTHTYHNPFYNNVFYFVSSKNNLIRIESKDKFNKSEITDDFFDNAYADIILQDVSKFRVAKHKKGNKIAIYIQIKGKEDYIYSFGPIKSLKPTTKHKTSPQSTEQEDSLPPMAQP